MNKLTVVTGDAAHRLSPDSRLQLNSTKSWIVSEPFSSHFRAEKAAEELRRKDAIIAELVEASKTSMHIHTSELPDEWMRSQAYEEAPYHFLWAAIAHATAKPEEKRD